MYKYLKDLCIIFIILLITLLIGLYLSNLNFREENITSIFILGVLIISTQIDKYILGIFSCVLSVLIFNFFFTAPKYSLETYDPKYFVTFSVMLIISLIIITLMSKIKKHIKTIENKSKQMKILLDLNRELEKNYTKDGIIKNSLIKISTIFNKDVDYEPYFPSNNQNQIFLKKFNFYVFFEYIYIPLRAKDKVQGVFIMNVSNFEDADLYFLVSIINQISVTIENLEAINEIRNIEFQIEEEKFKTNILRSISHDLRTPLTSISGSAYSLLTGTFSEKVTKELILDIYDESNWLIELIENLLSLSKIQNIKILTKNIELVEDIVEEAVHHSNKEIKNYILKINIEDNLTIKCDGNLLIQVLINLLNNAIKYTPKNSILEIIVFKKNSDIIFQVKDRGKGVSNSDKPFIFDSFYTKRKATGDSRRGLGLGLFLCKTIIQCHSGDIYVLDNDPNGSIFQFNIPIQEEFHGKNNLIS